MGIQSNGPDRGNAGAVIGEFKGLDGEYGSKNNAEMHGVEQSLEFFSVEGQGEDPGVP